MTIILRRRKLGATSCRGIVAASTKPMVVARNDLGIPDGHDLVIRWGCTANVPARRVLNRAEAIHLVNNKFQFRQVLQENDLCPRTWFNCEEYIRNVNEYPVIVRPDRHAQGRRLHVCSDSAQLRQACARYPVYYISELINKVSEYRVFVVQGRAACVAQKTPGNPDDVAWNVARGGRFDNVNWDNWPLKAVKKSIEAFNLSGLDFGGVDVMVDGDGEVYIIEINSAPSLTSEYRQSCMAKCFDYIIDNGKETIPLIEQRGGYRKFIHPAVCDRAQFTQES